METYKYEDLKIGQKASFTRVVAPEDVDKFRDLTEDINSLHSDEAYAEKTKFRKQVVYGLLIQSFLSKLAGVYLPGKYCLILSIQTNFKKPCFVGDILTISGEIIQKYDSANMIILKTNITNDKGESVLGGEMKIKLLK